MQYRVNWETSQVQIRDFFDGQDYKQFEFTNPDDVPIAFYTDGFTNRTKQMTIHAMIHAITFNFYPYISHLCLSCKIII